MPMIRNAVQDDIAHVVANIRDADRREIEAVTGKPLLAAIRDLEASPHLVFVIYHGEPVAIFGATLRPESRVADMFRFATDHWPEVVKEAIRFGRRRFLAKMWEAGIKRVEAVTLDAPDQTAWLKLFGAKEYAKFERNGLNFARFAIDRPA